MCQQEIYNYLKKKRGKEVTINELMLVIPANRGNISAACRKMAQRKEIRVRPVREGPFTRFLLSI
jgi:hypothetical protein